MNVVITGANRGIGLGLVRHYLGQGAQVWACCRQPGDELAALQQQGVHIVHWDVANDGPDSGTETFPDQVHLLINNAGIYGPKGVGSQSLESVTMDDMRQVFDIDCLGPLRVVRFLLPALTAGQAVIANISSKMGSVSDNTSGGSYAYRAAKGALVGVSRSMAVDLIHSGVRVLTLHPGWVRTDMTGHNGLIDVDESVAGMTDVISRAEDYTPGEFIAFDGKVIPY
jgi:NAD(P)-dependent dehydrogenase (short-subunit alcohol dehydrogenase family)